ncbi:unnamed protein product [Caenorhabditis nigoni]
MGQKWSGTNKSQSTIPSVSKSSSGPSMVAKPKSDREEKPKDTKSSSSASQSQSLRADDPSKQKANNEPLYENLSYKG